MQEDRTKKNFETLLTNRKKALAIWRSYGEDLRRVHRLRKSLDRVLGETFETRIIWRFWDPILGAIPDGECTGATIAAKIGVNPATPTRWLKNDWRDRTTISLRNFLFVVVALNVDFNEVEFRASQHVALEGYCSAFDCVAERMRTDGELSTEEAACLYYVARSWDWLVAMRDASTDLREIVASQILGNVTDLACTTKTLRDGQDIEALLKHRNREWAVLETVIQYEWFG